MTTKKGKNGSKLGNGSARSSRVEPEGPGLWRMFPIFMVVLGVVWGILWAPSDPLHDAETSKEATEPPKPRTTSTLHDVVMAEDDCGADQFLSTTHMVRGFHVACLDLDHGSGNVSVTVFQNGRRSVNQTLVLGREEASTHTFRTELKTRLGLDTPGKDPPNKFAWAMYTPDGRKKIETIDDAMESRLVFIFKGGVFIWPGVEVGHVQTVRGLPELGEIEIRTLSMVPLVFEAHNFLLSDECDHIKTRADPHLKPSPVSLMDHDQGKDDSNWRTSTTYFMPSRGDPKLKAIDQRVALFTRIPEGHQEQVQVLRYNEGQRYTAHHDYFNPKMYKKDKRTMESIDGGRRNRVVTVFWYLSDVEEGGETIFPRAGGRTGRVDFSDCTVGLKVKPRVGKVAMFYSMRPDGQFDDFSLHGACPVISGQKWAANKWVWSAPVGVRIQLMATMAPDAPKPSFPVLLTHMVRAEGLSSVYAGLSAAIMRQAIYGTARIGLHRTFSDKLKEMNNGKEIPFWMKTLSGMSSGAIAVTIGTPMDVALVRMQSDSMKPEEQRRNYRHVIDALRRVAAEEGLASLYAGLAPNILRGMSMNVGMMACYDQAKGTMMSVFGDPDPKKPSLPTKLSSSAIAGFTAAGFSLPFDMLKSRLQDMKPDKNGKMPYNGLADCALGILRKEGPMAFWTGFTAYYGRCAPHAMIILLSIETINTGYRSLFRLD